MTVRCPFHLLAPGPTGLGLPRRPGFLAFGRVRRAAAVLALTACTMVFAQAQPQPQVAAPAAKAASVPRPPVRPVPADDNITLWNELGPAEQRALRPLAASWAQLDEAQRRKWRALARDFDRMPPAEQTLLQARMTEWAALSPRQRSQARLNFAQTKNLPVEDKRAQWEAYQSLSPEERRRLAANAPKLPKGAAPALKPASSAKLVKPQPKALAPLVHPAPAPAHAASAAQPPITPRPLIDPRTLLPLRYDGLHP